MPQVAAPRSKLTRRSFQVVWWAYAAGLGVYAAVLLAGASRHAHGRIGISAGQEALLVVAAVVLITATASMRLMGRLPSADHRIFDTAGEPFERATGQLFTLFVISGAAAELAGAAGLVFFFLRGPVALAFVPIALGAFLLVRLRGRISPLLHYLA